MPKACALLVMARTMVEAAYRVKMLENRPRIGLQRVPASVILTEA
jgi:hypothetical protein